MAIEQFTRARDRLLRLVHGDAKLTSTLEAVLASLHEVTRFGRAALMTVDPQTLLPTSGIVQGFPPEACAPFWDHELLVPGFNKFTTLARSTDTVATLVEATDGDLGRAPIYPGLYASLAIADELRAAFVVGTTCWGIASLLRPAADGAFPDDEVDHVRRLAPLIGRALRASICKLNAQASGPPAVIVVDGRNRILHSTVQSGSVLDDLRTGGVAEPGLPTVVGIVATRARASRTYSHLATRVRGASGRWVRLTAVPLEGDAGSVAVTIESARAADLTPILLESYGLTDREAELVLLLSRGLATKEIAAELALSPHTIRDHVKTIFEKVHVNSRGELVAKLFSSHLLEPLHANVHRVNTPDAHQATAGRE